jgi:hypothetical protein
MATGNANIVAVIGKKDNAGAGESVRPRGWEAAHESEAVTFQGRHVLSLSKSGRAA